jgi:hypothetical protein
MWRCSKREKTESSDNQQNYQQRVWGYFTAAHEKINKVLQRITDNKRTEDEITPKEKAEIQKLSIEAFRALFVLQQQEKKMEINPTTQAPSKMKNQHLAGTANDIEHWYQRYMVMIQKMDMLNNLTSTELKAMLLHQSRNLGSNGGFGIASMNLLIHIEKEKNPNFECYAMDISQLKENLANILRSCDDMHERDYRKVQFVINNNGHYTTVDLKLTKNDKQFIVLDASNEVRVKETIATLRSNPKFSDGFAVTSSIQSDFISCPIFAFDHAVQASRTDLFLNIHDIVSKNDGVEWINLPPQFVWNAQSERWLNAYRKEYKEENADVDFNEPIHGGVSFNDYTDKAEIISFHNLKKDTQGECLDMPQQLFCEYGGMIQKHLSSATNDQLIAIYSNTSVPNKNTATPDSQCHNRQK